MNTHELTEKLKEILNNLGPKRKTQAKFLFGIIYKDEFQKLGLKRSHLDEIGKKAKVGDTAGVEIAKGAALAEYVNVKDEYKHLL